MIKEIFSDSWTSVVGQSKPSAKGIKDRFFFMANQRYSELLLDPRWQKKRLYVLEHGHFRCFFCGDEKTTLHVHHFVYTAKFPWEEPDENLCPACADCHWLIHAKEKMTEFERRLIDILIEPLRAFGNSSTPEKIAKYKEVIRVSKLYYWWHYETNPIYRSISRTFWRMRNLLSALPRQPAFMFD